MLETQSLTHQARGQHVENESMLRRAGATRVIVPPVLGANRAGLMVVALVHADGSQQFNPSSDLVLKADDEMIVIGEIGSVDKLVELYGSKAVH